MQALGQWWNTGSVISELVSSFLLMFTVMFTHYYLSKKTEKSISFKILIAFIYAFEGMFALSLGYIVGNAYEDHSATSLMSLPMTLIKSIYWNKFTFFITATSMQIIGSAIAALLYYGFLKYKKVNVNGYLFLSDWTERKYVTKETVVQLFFVGSLVFFGIIPFGLGIDGSFYISVFLSSVVLFPLFYFTTKYFYFLLSPQLLLMNLVIGHFEGITTWKHWRTLAIQITIQLSIVLLIEGSEYAIRTR